MGKIVKPLGYVGKKGTLEAETLLDSGASVSLIRRDIARKIAPIESAIQPVVLRRIDGHVWVNVSKVANLAVEMKGKRLNYMFYVVEEMPRKSIIGADFMQVWGIKLDLKREDYEVTVDPGSLEMASI